jgi:hypothetical protein
MNKKYTPREIRFLERRVIGHSYAELTGLFNEHFDQRLSVWQIKYFLYKEGLSNGIPQRFQKGHVSCLKGKKLPWLKRKNPEYNRKPIGTLRVNNGGYNVVKVADDPAVWKLAHHVIWEKAHGAIPAGHVLIFGDGNSRNMRLENLLLVSRKELATMNRNGLITADRDLTKAGKLVADIRLLINERKRKPAKRNGRAV